MDRKDLFNIGYGKVTEKTLSNKYMRSCFNCKYYYRAIGDSTELCQNNNVLKYDMIVSDNNIYCTQWDIEKSSIEDVVTAKQLFKKSRKRVKHGH
jgi:hypothetical protein